MKNNIKIESKSLAIQPFKEVTKSMIVKYHNNNNNNNNTDKNSIDFIRSLEKLNLIKLGYISKDLFKESKDFDSFDIYEGYKSVEGVLKGIEGLNRKGFVNNINIFDGFDYPILSNYSKLLLIKNRGKRTLCLDDKIDLGK